ncbi:MAG: phosphoesterase [Nitrospiraceae bacterium]|nr:MAG: phosphoesterase [Nitrospiraceae bacterium]
MKIIFVTDLHGAEWKYDRLFSAARDLKADIVINAGDMLPKHGDLFQQGEFISSFLRDHFSRFDSAGIYYLSYLGNDDLMIFDKVFEETCNQFSYIIPLAQRIFVLDGYEFIGMNWVVDYPFRLKDRCRMDTKDYVFQKQFGTGLLSTAEGWKDLDDWFAYAHSLPTIEEELIKLPHPENTQNSIYVIHMPPSGSGLDKCYNGSEVGSKAIYEFIMKHQPKLTLHGHIHESPVMTGKWYAKNGKTICIQPGQLDDFTYVTIDLDAMEFDRFREKYREILT